MAYPESGAFSAVVQGLFSEQQLVAQNRQLGRMRGPYGHSIAQWEREGLGRMIGMRIPDRPTSQYRKIGYALPLTDERVAPHAQRVVVLLEPEQTDNKFMLIGPAQSQSEYPAIQEAENRKNVEAFRRVFHPSPQPYLLDPRNGDNTRPILLVNRLDMVSNYSTGVTNPAGFVRAAETNARRLRQERVQFGAVLLRAEVDLEPGVVDAMVQIEREWVVLGDQIRLGRNIQLFPDLAPDKPQAA